MFFGEVRRLGHIGPYFDVRPSQAIFIKLLSQMIPEDVMYRIGLSLMVLSVNFAMLPFVSAQVKRDPQALSVATQAFKALGGAFPTDSRAIGNYDRVVGSSEDTGTVEILTRGTGQTSEKLTNSSRTSQVVAF